MSEFGDYEPEDAWHPADHIALQIGNLLQRLDLLDAADPEGRWRPFLVDIEHRLRPWIERRDTGQLEPRDETRVNQLLEDLAFVRERDDRGS